MLGGEVRVGGLGADLWVDLVETIAYEGDPANDDLVTVWGTPTADDLLTAAAGSR